MEKLLLMIMLGIYAIEDVKSRKISVQYLPLWAIIGLLLQFFFKGGTVWDVMGGALTGGVVLLLGVVTKGGIGMGDGVLLMVMGIYLGAAKNLGCFLLGLVFASVWSLGIIILQRKGRKWEIPFVPFLFAAYLTMSAGGSI